MRLGIIGAVGLIGCGSSGGANPEPLGIVALSRGGDGDLVIQDLVGGDVRVIDDAGPFGAMAFSLDGTELAYANPSHEVFIAQLGLLARPCRPPQVSPRPRSESRRRTLCPLPRHQLKSGASGEPESQILK